MAIAQTTFVNDDGELESQEHDLGNQAFVCVVHQQGLKVDIKEAVEINSFNTIDCVQKLTQPAWEWISEGGIFKHLSNKVLNNDDKFSVVIPKDVEVLKQMDLGVQHVVGMIILGCEALFQGNTKVFFRNPETHLHPRIERLIVEMLMDLMKLCSKPGDKTTVETETVTQKVKSYVRKDGTEVKEHERKKSVTLTNEDKQSTLNWLNTLLKAYNAEKEIVSMNGNRMNIGQMIEEVSNETKIGKWMIQEFLKLRDR